MKDFYIEHNDISLHCRLDLPYESSSCPLVIIFHGLTGHMEEEHISALAKACNEIGFAVLRVDLYGHGKSGGEFADHTISIWLEEVLAVTDYAKSLPFVTELYIAGHSQGGLVAALAGGIRPEDYRGVILLSPALNIPENARYGAFLHEFRFDPENLPESFDCLGSRLNGSYLADAQQFDVNNALRQYTRQTLIVHGDHDDIIPLFVSQKAASFSKNCTLAVIDGADHDYNYHSSLMTEAVKKFLQVTC